MNSQTLTNIGIIVGGLVGLIGVVIGYRQSKIVAEQRLSELIAEKVTTATAPLLAQLTQQRENFREQLTAVRDQARADATASQRVIDRHLDTIAALTARVDVLEDELRRGRGHGDNDAARQPPSG